MLVQRTTDVNEAVDLFVKAGFTNFLYGMKRSELCGKKDLPMHEFGKYLSECDHANSFPQPRREGVPFHKRPFSSGHQFQTEPRNEPLPPSSNNNNNSVDKQIGVKEVKPEPQARKSYNTPITCHNCGEPGHIRPNCPHRGM